MYQTLSTAVRRSASAVDSSLERLSCVSQGITEIDIHPAVLAVLTNPRKHAVPAPVSASVAHRAETAHDLPSSSAGGSSPMRTGTLATSGAGRPDGESDGEPGFNVAIAFSLHTVLLCRNSLRDLIGIVQFKNVVRLSLLGNRIATIDACEPLALLPQLAYLSLEFNPVTTLPHYQAHLLRICSWPKPLAARTCRLKKLDAAAVTVDMVQRAVRCLLREASLLPELSHRIRLVCFLSHVARQQRLVAEMRRRGLLRQHRTEAAPGPTLDSLFERCGGTAVRAMEARDAAHLCRVLVRDHQCRRRRRSQGGGRQRAHMSNEAQDEEDSIEPAHWSSITSLLVSGIDADEDDEEEEAENGPRTHAAGAEGANNSELLTSVSEILLSGDLSSHASYLKSTHHDIDSTICHEWSMDWFRLTISSLDVHLCRLLLRLARTLGQAIGSSDVDHLLRRWLRLLAETPEATATAVNVTGERRPMPSVNLVGRPVPERREARQSATSRPALAARSADTSVVSAMTEDDVAAAAADEDRTTPSTLVLDVDDEDTSAGEVALTWRTAESVEAEDADAHAPRSTTTTTTRTSAPSSTRAPTEVEPRTGAPIPAAPSPESPALGKPPLLPLLPAPHHSATGGLNQADGEMSEEDVRACQFRLAQWKGTAWRQWRQKLRTHAQRRQCDAFIQTRVANTFRLDPGSALLHAVLPRLPYTERKRFFFDHWRMAYEAAQMTRLWQVQARFRQWRRRCFERGLSREAAQLARAGQLRAALTTWRAQVVSRRLVLPGPLADKAHAGPAPRPSELSRVLLAPHSLQGLCLAQSVNERLLDAALRGPGLHKAYATRESCESPCSPHPTTPGEGELPGLSPSHPMNGGEAHLDARTQSQHGARSPSPLLSSSPVVDLEGLSSYRVSPSPVRPPTRMGSPSACRYATGHGVAREPTPYLRVSLPRDQAPALTPPPPLHSALRWSNAGLARSVAPAAYRRSHGQARPAVILAPAELVASPPPPCSPALARFGGPYPAKDVEALVYKAGLLQREHHTLSTALRTAAHNLHEAEQAREAANGKADGLESMMKLANARVTALQGRAGDLLTEVGMLENVIATLRHEQHGGSQRDLERALGCEGVTP